MNLSANPFPRDADHAAIWTMRVARDIAAYVAADWSLVAEDFVTDGFVGIDAVKSGDPDGWRINFPTLAAYRDEWLRQARAGQQTAYAEDVEAAIHRATTLVQIDIAGEMAMAHKKFDGAIERADGTRDVLAWQTLYLCRKVAGVWKLAGFVGYLPFPMVSA